MAYYQFKELSLEDRLKTYESALGHIKEKKDIPATIGYSLCLILPVLHWKLPTLCSLIEREVWMYNNISVAFPELKRYITTIDNVADEDKKNMIRLVCLKLMIKSVKAKMKTQQRKSK